MTTDTTLPLTVIGDLEELLAAGRTLATLAEPGRDLDALGSDILEIAATLRCLGKGMQQARELIDAAADTRYDLLAAGKLYNHGAGRLWTRDEIELDRDNELKRERATAQRTAKLALVSLQALVCEMGAP